MYNTFIYEVEKLKLVLTSAGFQQVGQQQWEGTIQISGHPAPPDLAHQQPHMLIAYTPVIGVSVSEPHTSLFYCDFSYVYTAICEVWGAGVKFPFAV